MSDEAAVLVGPAKAQVDELTEVVSEIGDGLTTPGLVQGVDTQDVALAVYDDQRGLIAPLVRNDGRALQTGPSGTIETIPLRSEIPEFLDASLVSALVGGETPREVTVDSATNTVVHVVTKEGGVWSLDESNKALVRAGEATSIAIMAPLVAGETPREVIVDAATNIILRVDTWEGGIWLLNRSTAALVRSGSAGAAATAALAYSAQPWTAGQGQTTRLHYISSPDVCLILPTLGQSLALGQNATTDTLLATTPLYPGRALMFAGGPRRSGMGNTALVDLVESVSGTARETAASGWANHLIRDIYDALAVYPRTLSFVTAVGGTPYMGLKRGQTAYASFLAAVEDAVTACRANGWTPIVPAIDWMQGESDTDLVPGVTKNKRMRQMQQFARQLRADVQARTGQAEPPVLLITQQGFTPGQAYTGGNGDLWDQPVRRAALDLDGVDGIRLVGPIHQHPYADVIHINSLGQNRRGQALARATVAEIFGVGWASMAPREWYWASAAELRVVFDYALAIDTSNDLVNTANLVNQGLYFDDGSGSPPAIGTVSVVNAAGRPWAYELVVPLAAAPTGQRPRLGYATRRDVGNATQDGPIVGARGTLRGTAGHTSLYDGGKVNYDWVPAFILNLFKP